MFTEVTPTPEFSDNDFLGIAPPTLRRKSEPNILSPEVFVSATDDQGILPLVEAASQNGQLHLWQVSAFDVLKSGFSTPKCVGDDGSMWYYDLPREVLGYLGTQIYGRKKMEAVTPTTSIFKSGPAAFDNNARGWYGEFVRASQYARLWEMGVVIVGKNDQVGLISISNPWHHDEKSPQDAPWHKKLSSSELRNFVGREDVLKIASDIISNETGISPKDPLTRAFNTSQIQMWWAEAMNRNKILNWSEWDEHKKTHKPTFAESIVLQLKDQIHPNILHRLLKNCRGIFGYTVNAFPEDFPGATRLDLNINGKNWLEVRMQKKEKIPSYNTPPYRTMWVYGGERDLLSNYDLDAKGDKNFSFTIKLAEAVVKGDEFEGSVGVQTLYVRRGVKMKGEISRDKVFAIGDPERGDCWKWDRTRSKTIWRSLEKEDWFLLARLFNEARERAVVDNICYYKPESKVKFTKRTLAILENTRGFIKAKMQEAGITDIEIDKNLA